MKSVTGKHRQPGLWPCPPADGRPGTSPGEMLEVLLAAAPPSWGWRAGPAWHAPRKCSINVAPPSPAARAASRADRLGPATQDSGHISSSTLREHKLPCTAQTQQNSEGPLITCTRCGSRHAGPKETTIGCRAAGCPRSGARPLGLPSPVSQQNTQSRPTLQGPGGPSPFSPPPHRRVLRSRHSSSSQEA